MASGTFSLGEDGGKSLCTKVLIFAVVALVVVAAVVVSIFAFKSSSDADECGSPNLDPNGLSNYSVGAMRIAMGCFPGYFMDQNTVDPSGLVISECVDKRWIPEPPECNYLPLRIDCMVDRNGLRGFVTMMQMEKQNETKILGLIKYEEAINPKGEGHLNEIIEISRHAEHCTTNTNYNISQEIDEIGEITDPYFLKVGFDSMKLAAYRAAEVHLNMIFLDVNTTVNLISVHQGKITLVMPTKLPTFEQYEKLGSPGVKRAFEEFREYSSDDADVSN